MFSGSQASSALDLEEIKNSTRRMSVSGQISFKMVPFLKDINRINKMTKEEKVKQYCRIIFTEGVGDRILLTTFQNFNAVDVSMLRQLNRAANFLIVRNNTEFAFLSNDARDNEQWKPLPNLTMFRMLNRFKGI